MVANPGEGAIWAAGLLIRGGRWPVDWPAGASVVAQSGHPVRVHYRDRPRSDKELSHPSPVAIEMRCKIPLLPRRRG